MKYHPKESGQTIVEYVLVLLMVVGATKIILDLLPAQIQKFERALSQDYVASYRYGDIRTKGPEEGAYDLHPRVSTGNNFRMWKRSHGQ